MAYQGAEIEQASLGELFGRLSDDGKAYARAEVNLYKQMALQKVNASKTALIVLVASLFLITPALVLLLGAFALLLGEVMDQTLATFIVAIVALAAAGGMAYWGASRLGQVASGKVTS